MFVLHRPCHTVNFALSLRFSLKMLSSYELKFSFQGGHLEDTTFSFTTAGRYYMIDISINRYDVIFISIFARGVSILQKRRMKFFKTK